MFEVQYRHWGRFATAHVLSLFCPKAIDGKTACIAILGSLEMVEYFVSYYQSNQLYCRCSVGELTNEQVAEFKKRINIDNISDFYLECVNKLSISLPKDNPVHLKAIKTFQDGIVNLANCSEQYCKLMGDATGVIKPFVDHCTECGCMHNGNCDYSCDWYTVCIHPIFCTLAPASHNFNFNLSVLDTPVFQRLDIQSQIQFRRSISRVRHIVVMCELKQLVEEVRSKAMNVDPAESANANYRQQTQAATDIPTAKKRHKVTEEQLQKAVKLVMEEEMTQNAAEKNCGLYRGALSSGRGKDLLDALVAMEAQAHKELMTVSNDVGNDFRYNKVR